MENNEQFNDPTMMDSSVDSSFEGTPNGTEKAFAVLAYFGLLWLIVKIIFINLRSNTGNVVSLSNQAISNLRLVF